MSAARLGDRGVGVPLHELMKRMAFDDPNPDLQTHFERSRPAANATVGVSDHYLTLDSFVKSTASDPARGVYAWDMMVEGVTGDDHLGSRYTLENVTEIEMNASSFPIVDDVPYVTTTDPPIPGIDSLNFVQNNGGAPGEPPTLIQNTPYPYGQYPYASLQSGATHRFPWINNPYCQLPNGNRLTVQVAEAGLQAASDVGAIARGGGVAHHFDFSVGYYALVGGTNPNFAQTAPTGATVHVFTEPIKSFESLTLVFRNPDTPVVFRPDVYVGVTASLELGPFPGPFIQFDVADHGLSAGDRIYVGGCATGVPGIDNYVNRAVGHCVYGDPYVDHVAFPIPPGAPIPTPDTFWTDPAIGLGQFTAPPAFPQRVTVYVLKRRLLIPFRLRGVYSRMTQGKAP
jgi:hypothetical protein